MDQIPNVMPLEGLHGGFRSVLSDCLDFTAPRLHVAVQRNRGTADWSDSSCTSGRSLFNETETETETETGSSSHVSSPRDSRRFMRLNAFRKRMAEGALKIHEERIAENAGKVTEDILGVNVNGGDTKKGKEQGRRKLVSLHEGEGVGGVGGVGVGGAGRVGGVGGRRYLHPRMMKWDKKKMRSLAKVVHYKPPEDFTLTEEELKGCLESALREEEKQILEAIKKLRNFSKVSQDSRQKMVNSGVIPVLVTLLNSRDVNVVENAAAAIFNLAWEIDFKRSIAACGAVLPLTKVMFHSSSKEAQNSALGALCNLSVEPSNRAEIRAAGVVPHFIKELKCGNAQARKDAAVGLVNMAMEHSCREQMVAFGTIELVLQLLEKSDKDFEEVFTLLLATLVKSAEGCSRVLEANGVGILGDILEGASNRVQANALSVLLRVGERGEVAIRVLKSDLFLPTILKIAESPYTRAREKASALAALMRNMK